MRLLVAVSQRLSGSRTDALGKAVDDVIKEAMREARNSVCAKRVSGDARFRRQQ